MTTLPDRPNTALLVIDVQKGVVAEAHERDKVIANIDSLVGRARDEDVAGDLGAAHRRRDATGQRDLAVRPRAGADGLGAARHKSYGDSFEDTDLEERLAERGVGRLVVTGAETDACIRSTIHGAFVRGYDVTLVKDAHTMPDYSNYGAPTPDVVISHTNLYWQFQRAPGRRGDAVDTSEVSFAAAEPG